MIANRFGRAFQYKKEIIIKEVETNEREKRVYKVNKKYLEIARYKCPLCKHIIDAEIDSNLFYCDYDRDEHSYEHVIELYKRHNQLTFQNLEEVTSENQITCRFNNEKQGLYILDILKTDFSTILGISLEWQGPGIYQTFYEQVSSQALNYLEQDCIWRKVGE